MRYVKVYLYMSQQKIQTNCHLTVKKWQLKTNNHVGKEAKNEEGNVAEEEGAKGGTCKDAEEATVLASVDDDNKEDKEDEEDQKDADDDNKGDMEDEEDTEDVDNDDKEDKKDEFVVANFPRPKAEAVTFLMEYCENARFH